MFSKILVANRGEIAVRVIRACKEMGISTVAVYSEADAESLHVAMADESYCIGPSEALDSYLNQERIISAALVSGAQAIHPGYGFLSENADFAKLVSENEIIFIGPQPETVRKLGNKEKIKEIMQARGLPVIPGTGRVESEKQAIEMAEKIGYPVMLKASSGGGGRGIRLVKDPSSMNDAYLAAASEAKAAFGDDSIYMEKYINPARHVEFQIMSDEFGNVVCLGERDCSIQRRNRKIVEESPSPTINQAQRSEMIEKIIKAMQGTGYTGVGTLEFLVDEKGNFYFMEMNIRLQVEHTVTESLTAIDLVKWQIRIAAGMPISFKQEDIDLNGVSIECRINAVGPGKVNFMHIPGGPFVRFDTGLVVGAEVTGYYDSLIGKLIIYAGNREEAVRKMKAALCELIIEGVPDNIEQLIDIVDSKEFMNGKYDLNFVVK